MPKPDYLDELENEVDGELDEYLNDELELEEEEKPKKKPKKVKQQTIEIDGKKYNKDDIATIIKDTKQYSEEKYNTLQQNLLKALGGNQEENDDDFNELDFINDKKYRDEYLKRKLDAMLEEKLKDVNNVIQQQSATIGDIRYSKVKDRVKKALYSTGIDFDYDKHEKEIEKIIFDNFNENKIKNDPDGVILYAIEELTKKRGLRNALSKHLDDVAVTGAIPVGHKKSEAEDIRNRILSATDIGGDDIKDNPFI